LDQIRKDFLANQEFRHHQYPYQRLVGAVDVARSGAGGLPVREKMLGWFDNTREFLVDPQNPKTPFLLRKHEIIILYNQYFI
jgi:hypothetical protein